MGSLGAPCGSREGLQHPRSFGGSLYDIPTMRGESVVGVKGHTQNLRLLIQRKNLIAHHHLRVEVRLIAFIWGEQCDRGLWGRDPKVPLLGPSLHIAGMCCENLSCPRHHSRRLSSCEVIRVRRDQITGLRESRYIEIEKKR